MAGDTPHNAVLPIVEKVVAYITKGDRLLVFRHVDLDAGVQVPAGTLEPGEPPADGVMREAREETGLESLVLRGFLGTRDYDMSSFGKAKTHRRHYFHLECTGSAPEIWRHLEAAPSGSPSTQIEFALYWVKLPEVVPELAAGQGAYLAEIRGRLRSWG